VNKKADLRIAILGWGSLIWNKRPEFDDCMGNGRMTARYSNWNSPAYLPKAGKAH
jgi:hypothetical protein